jgi:hypothetical protein
MRDDGERKDRFLVVIVVLIILAGLFLAAVLLLSTNEGLVRCRDKLGGFESKRLIEKAHSNDLSAAETETPQSVIAKRDICAGIAQ